MKQVKRATLCIMPFWKEGMTVNQVARDLGVNSRTVSALRKGTFKGDWATLLNAARYFGVPVETLIQIEEEQEPQISILESQK